MSNVAEIVKQEQDRRAGVDDASMRRRVRRALDELARAEKQMQQAEIDLTDARKVLEDAKAAVDAANAGDPSKLPADPGEPGVVRLRDQRDSILDMIQRAQEQGRGNEPWPIIGDPPFRHRRILPMLADSVGAIVAVG